MRRVFRVITIGEIMNMVFSAALLAMLLKLGHTGGLTDNKVTHHFQYDRILASEDSARVTAAAKSIVDSVNAVSSRQMDSMRVMLSAQTDSTRRARSETRFIQRLAQQESSHLTQLVWVTNNGLNEYRALIAEQSTLIEKQIRILDSLSARTESPRLAPPTAPDTPAKAAPALPGPFKSKNLKKIKRRKNRLERQIKRRNRNKTL